MFVVSPRASRTYATSFVEALVRYTVCNLSIACGSSVESHCRATTAPCGWFATIILISVSVLQLHGSSLAFTASGDQERDVSVGLVSLRLIQHVVVTTGYATILLSFTVLYSAISSLELAHARIGVDPYRPSVYTVVSERVLQGPPSSSGWGRTSLLKL